MTGAPLTGDPPSVGAVVVNYNGGERTLRCVEALTRQTHAVQRIVVVDNGSHDGSPEEVRRRFSGVEVVELSENRGLPAARNVGLASVPTSLVLLVDSDVYLEPDALTRLLDAQRVDAATVVCPRIRLLPERDIVQTDGAAAHFLGTMVLLHGYRPVHELPAERRRVPGCIGACYLLDRERVLAAGGFREDFFFYFEDLEFMLRLSARGHEFVCEPGALAYHDRGEGTPGLSFRGEGKYPPRRAFLSMRNRWLTILTHYRARTLGVLLPALVLYEIAVVIFALTRGWGGPWWRSWTWQLRNFREVARERRIAQRGRVRSDRELLVGGPIPLAPGVVRSPALKRAVGALSFVLDAYWRAARPLIG